MRQPRQIKQTLDLKGIADAVQLRFTRKGDSNEIVSRSQAINIEEKGQRMATSLDLKILKQRI